MHGKPRARFVDLTWYTFNWPSTDRLNSRFPLYYYDPSIFNILESSQCHQVTLKTPFSNHRRIFRLRTSFHGEMTEKHWQRLWSHCGGYLVMSFPSKLVYLTKTSGKVVGSVVAEEVEVDTIVYQLNGLSRSCWNTYRFRDWSWSKCLTARCRTGYFISILSRLLPASLPHWTRPWDRVIDCYGQRTRLLGATVSLAHHLGKTDKRP